MSERYKLYFRSNNISIFFKKISLLLFFIFITLATTGCTNSIINSSEDGSNIIMKKDCSSLEPDNPYSSGGHYAGFEWAQKNRSSYCSGNSQSFIDGCEEYVRQEEIYNNCLNK